MAVVSCLCLPIYVCPCFFLVFLLSLVSLCVPQCLPVCRFERARHALSHTQIFPSPCTPHPTSHPLGQTQTYFSHTVYFSTSQFNPRVELQGILFSSTCCIVPTGHMSYVIFPDGLDLTFKISVELQSIFLAVPPVIMF